MKAAIYVRVSTGNQTTNNQKIELESYCRRQGWEVTGTYDDSGISGSKQDRPGLSMLLNDAASHRFDVLLVYKLDRLGRSVIDLLDVLGRLQAFGVAFVAVTQQIDTTTAYGRMVMTFLAAVAEFEKTLIVERVNSGIARARAEGTTLGRPRVAVDVKRALALRAEGLGLKAIARKLNVPRSTIHRTLQAIPKTLVA